MGKDTRICFGQSPHHKTRYIQKLQTFGARVMMIGDGLNDAGALRQADTGIAISENCNNFTPASDAILDSRNLNRLPAFIAFCKAEKKIIMTSFIISILYNIIGLSFAVQGDLSPMIAAILMPASSLTILLLTYGCSNLVAKWLRLSGNTEEDQSRG
jgi:Cu+-exporting ATPase